MKPDNDEPDFPGMINAKITYPAGTFTGRIMGGDRVEQQAVIEALIERGRVWPPTTTK